MKATPYSPSAKMGLQMKRRFWEEDDKIFGGHLYSNLPFGDFAYPSWGYFGNKGVLLGFYGNGQMSGVINMPIKDRIEHVLTHASKVHPQIRAEYETAYCTFWEKMPYSLGAFAGGGGGGAGANADRLADARQTGRPDLPRMRGRQRKRRLAGRRRRGRLETGEAAPRAGDDQTSVGQTASNLPWSFKSMRLQNLSRRSRSRRRCVWTPAAAQSVKHIQTTDAGASPPGSGWATCST